MSVWDDFNRLSVLKVEFLQNSAAKNAIIYGNGNNQVAVVLHATVLGKDNKPLNIPQDEMLNATHLINYTTGEKLNWKGNVYNNSPWEYSDVDKGYSNPVNYGSAVGNSQENKTEGAFTIIYYISSSHLSSGLDVAAGINVPGVGEFNTTADGTSTKNSPSGATGSVFKSPSFVHVQALDNIDYSLSKNVRLENNTTSFSSFYTVHDNMLVVHNNWASVNYDNYEGTSSKATATITPALDNLKFRKINVLSASVNSGFHLPDGGCDTVWGVGGAHYDTTFIFVNRKHYGLLSSNTIHAKCGGEDYYYTIGSADNGHHWTEDLIDGAITIRICNHRIPRNDSHQKGWGDSGKDIRVYVTDEYGNSGTVSITVNDSSWPALHVNA